MADLKTRLARVRRAHEEYLDLHAELDDARGRADRLERQVQAAKAAAAREELAELEDDYGRAADLKDTLPDERPDPVEDDERIQAVTDAIAAFENRPEVPSLPDGATAEELQTRLEELPATPDGETEPTPAVEQAAEALEDARRRLRFHQDSEPAPSQPDPDSEQTEAEPETTSDWPATRMALAGGGGAVAAAGVGLLVAGVTVIGAVLAVAGVAALVAGLLRTPERARDAAAVERRVAARERRTWERRRDRHQEEIAAKEEQLREALVDRGVEHAAADDVSVDAVLDDYRQACRRRATQAEEAARRSDLEERLRSRRDAEQAAAQARARRRQAHERVQAAADRVGVDGEDPAVLVDALRRWRRDRRAEQEQRTAERDRWTKFETLMDGRTLEDLQTEIDRQREKLPPMPDGIEPEEADALADRLDELKTKTGQAREAVANLEGRIEDKEGDFDSVVEAEEQLQRARDERDRVQALDETLELTHQFLDKARERVQRDIAPRLKDAVETYLPGITGGRYRHVNVDPDTLVVQVSPDGTRWRQADRLSQGTAEQIYLLLRIAMAEHAVTTDEVAPLILDDVTVQSDPTRTQRLLDLLHQLSSDRQVIVFTQEPDVRDWARDSLPDDAVVELDPETIPA